MATTWAPVVDRPGAEPGTASLGSTGELLHFCELSFLTCRTDMVILSTYCCKEEKK